MFSEPTSSECWCCNGLPNFTCSVLIYEMNHFRFRPPAFSNTKTKYFLITKPYLAEQLIVRCAIHCLISQNLFEIALIGHTRYSKSYRMKACTGNHLLLYVHTADSAAFSVVACSRLIKSHRSLKSVRALGVSLSRSVSYNCVPFLCISLGEVSLDATFHSFHHPNFHLV